MRLGRPLALCLLLAAPAARAADYQLDVLPLPRERCYRCHDASKQRSGYRLDIRSKAMRGGESGKPAIVPGDSARSDLVRRITTAEGSEAMPPGGERLSASQVQA